MFSTILAVALTTAPANLPQRAEPAVRGRKVVAKKVVKVRAVRARFAVGARVRVRNAFAFRSNVIVASPFVVRSRAVFVSPFFSSAVVVNPFISTVRVRAFGFNAFAGYGCSGGAPVAQSSADLDSLERRIANIERALANPK